MVKAALGAQSRRIVRQSVPPMGIECSWVVIVAAKVFNCTGMKTSKLDNTNKYASNCNHVCFLLGGLTGDAFRVAHSSSLSSLAKHMLPFWLLGIPQ